MLTIDEFARKVSMDAYGGSAELVDDAILCFTDEINNCLAADVSQLCDHMGYCVDRTLAACNAILPLINLLNMCMTVCMQLKNENDLEKARTAIIAALEKRKAEQADYLNNIAQIGSRLVRDGAVISTFSTSGSVMGIFKQLKAQGKRVSITCHEARPHSEGFRTFREVSALGFPVTIGTDAALTQLTRKSDAFFIGADAITSTGFVFAKMGSYLAALCCKEFGVPFYVAADTTKFDILSLLGFPLKDSSRPANEVCDMEVPDGSNISNVTFEMVPPYLVTGIITQYGIISPGAVSNMMNPSDINPGMIEKLLRWAEK